MSEYVGRRAELGMARETIRKTAVNPAYWIPYKSIDFDDTATLVVEDSAMGQIGDSDDTHTTKRFGEGSVEAEFYDVALGLILCGVFGQIPVTNPAGTHTYTLLDESNSHQSLSILVQDPNGSTMFPISMVDTFEMTIEPEALVNYTVSFRSRGGKQWNAQTSDFADLGYKFQHRHLMNPGGFRVDTTIGGLATATWLDIRSLTLTIEKNPVDWDDVGTASPGDILNRQMSVGGTVELGYVDRTWRDYMINSTALAMEIYLYNNASSSLKLQFPRVKFQSWEPDKSLDEIATQTLDFKCHYDAANAQKIIHTGVLINGQAGNY